MRWTCPQLLHYRLEGAYCLPFALRSAMRPRQLLLAVMFTAFFMWLPHTLLSGRFIRTYGMAPLTLPSWSHLFSQQGLHRGLLNYPASAIPENHCYSTALKQNKTAFSNSIPYNRAQLFDVCHFIFISVTLRDRDY